MKEAAYGLKATLTKRPTASDAVRTRSHTVAVHALAASAVAEVKSNQQQQSSALQACQCARGVGRSSAVLLRVDAERLRHDG